jgi:hypothetical protein
VSDFWTWIVAVIEHWHGWVSGSFIAFVLELGDRFWDWKPSRKLFALILVIGFLISIFSAWREEHRKYVEKAEELEKLSKPKFILSVFSSVNFYVEKEDKTVMFPTVRIINQGADSIVADYKAHYHSPTLDQDVMLFNLTQPLDVPTPIGRFILRPSDPINAQTGPIARGNAGTGRLPVIFSGNKVKEIGEGAQLVITVWDYLGTPYSVTFTGTSSQQNFIQAMPGEPIAPGSGLRY